MPRRSGPIITYPILNKVTAAVCRALHEAPLRMLAGGKCESRAYVAEVLTRAFPDTPVRVVLRWCGSRNVDEDAALIAKLMASGAWRDSVVAIGFGAIDRRDLIVIEDQPVPRPAPQPVAIVAPPVPPPAPEPKPEPRRPMPPPMRPWHIGMAPERRSDRPSPYRRVIVRDEGHVVAMGEPAPERSALFQRQQAEREGRR